MDALPGLPLTLHLSCSLPSSSINGRPLRFLWLLFTILISWLSSHCDGACQKPFTCGFYSLAYPFGGRNSGCGDPALQLDCDSYLGMPLINISGHQYYIRLPTVFSAENSSQSMTIIDNNLWGSSCDPSSSNNTAQFWSSPQFHIANDYKNITLGEQCEQEILPSNASKLECSDDWYYIPTSNLSLATPAYCKSYVQLPVNIDPKLPRSMSLTEIVQQGFEIEWNFSRGCENCVSRNGTCNYNTRTMKPFCQMEDAILNLSNSGSKFKSISFVFILAAGILGSALLIVALLLAIAHRKNNSTFGRQVLRGKRGPVTDKSDVYGFGMMILEMVGGRKNVDLQVSRSSQFYFPDWAIKLVERGELRTRLREIELSDAEEVKARSLVKVGLWCIQHISIARPSMMRVLQMLEGDVDDIPNPPTPFDSRPRPAPFSSSEESSSIGIETAS
ncbi:hypothetical protein SUGI_0116560 [Cryptomeria japonica]|nr:hypothetical protein SUGI_0116560 [Cryptomeria japonica]